MIEVQPLVFGLVLAAVVVAVNALAVQMLADRRARRAAEYELEVERDRVTDLHNRLAARSYGEFAAFQQAPARPEEPETEWIFDSTGLIGAEVPYGEA